MPDPVRGPRLTYHVDPSTPGDSDQKWLEPSGNRDLMPVRIHTRMYAPTPQSTNTWRLGAGGWEIRKGDDPTLTLLSTVAEPEANTSNGVTAIDDNDAFYTPQQVGTNRHIWRYHTDDGWTRLPAVGEITASLIEHLDAGRLGYLYASPSVTSTFEAATGSKPWVMNVGAGAVANVFPNMIPDGMPSGMRARYPTVTPQGTLLVAVWCSGTASAEQVAAMGWWEFAYDGATVLSGPHKLGWTFPSTPTGRRPFEILRDQAGGYWAVTDGGTTVGPEVVRLDPATFTVLAGPYTIDDLSGQTIRGGPLLQPAPPVVPTTSGMRLGLGFGPRTRGF